MGTRIDAGSADVEEVRVMGSHPWTGRHFPQIVGSKKPAPKATR